MSEKFVYRNPVCPEVVKNIRDPFIMLEGDRYYLTGTTPPFWDGNSQGVFLWSSDDLINWKEEKFILHRSVAEENSWFKDYWWAPEIHKKDGKFYLTVNCRNDKLGIGQNPLIAVSDRIDGDYTVLNAAKPFFTKENYEKGLHPCTDGNDANLFTDDDGKTYITTCSYSGIHLYEIDLEKMELVGEPVLVVEVSEEGWDTKNEGQFIIKHKEKYYCFYSSFTRSYEVGVAFSDSIRGPWLKDERNPLITPFGVDGLHHSGHNSVFTDKEGRMWTAYHITFDSDHDTQLLAIDPVYFDEEGRVQTPAPTLHRMEI